MSKQGAKRARKIEHIVPSNHAAGRPQLLLVKTELQSWLGKSFCNEAELMPMLLAHSIVRRVRTIDVEVRPLGGDSFKIALDTRRPLVSEAKAEIARVQGTREGKQELYRVATRADGGAVREDDAEPELLDDEDMELKDGELHVVAMAVKENGFEPLHAEEEHTLAGHNDGVFSLVMHGDKLISGSGDNTIKVWSTDTWACERTLEGHEDAVWSSAMHGDKLISGSTDGTIKVWSTDTWTCEHTLEGHDGTVWSLVMHGDKLISGSTDGTIKVWSTDTWACEHTLEGHDDGVSSLAMHGDTLISGSSIDGTIKEWSTDTWACERTLEGHNGGVECMLVHGDKLISGSENATIKVWSTDTWTCEGTLEGHRNAVFFMVMHGDNLISSSNDHTIKVWSTNTWTCERTLEDHDNAVNCLVVYGDKLLSSSADSTIKVWGSASLQRGSVSGPVYDGMLHDSDKSASNTSSLLEQVRDRKEVAQGGDGCQEITG
jgi:WD40 repeat protein